MTYLDRLGWSGRGLQRLLGRMGEQELLTVGRQDPYLRTHPLSRDRLEFVSDWVERGHVAAPTRPSRPGWTRRSAWCAPSWTASSTRRSPPGGAIRRATAPPRPATPAPSRSTAPAGPTRRSTSWTAWCGSSRAIPGCGSCKGRSCSRRGACPGGDRRRCARRRGSRPGEALIRLALGRALMESGDPALLPRRGGGAGGEPPRWSARTPSRGASSASRRAGSGGWRRPTSRWRRKRCSLADFPGARMLARRAEEALPPGPLRLRAADLRHAAQRDNMTREQREQENTMRRRPRP